MDSATKQLEAQKLANYFETHDLRTLLSGLHRRLAFVQPEDPLTFLIDQVRNPSKLILVFFDCELSAVPKSWAVHLFMKTEDFVSFARHPGQKLVVGCPDSEEILRVCRKEKIFYDLAVFETHASVPAEMPHISVDSKFKEIALRNLLHLDKILASRALHVVLLSTLGESPSQAKTLAGVLGLRYFSPAKLVAEKAVKGGKEARCLSRSLVNVVMDIKHEISLSDAGTFIDLPLDTDPESLETLIKLLPKTSAVLVSKHQSATFLPPNTTTLALLKGEFTEIKLENKIHSSFEDLKRDLSESTWGDHCIETDWNLPPPQLAEKVIAFVERTQKAK